MLLHNVFFSSLDINGRVQSLQLVIIKALFIKTILTLPFALKGPKVFHIRILTWYSPAKFVLAILDVI